MPCAYTLILLTHGVTHITSCSVELGRFEGWRLTQSFPTYPRTGWVSELTLTAGINQPPVFMAAGNRV